MLGLVVGQQQVERDAEARSDHDDERQPEAQIVRHARGGDDQRAERLRDGEDLGQAEEDGERGDREQRAQHLGRHRPTAVARWRAVLPAAAVLQEVVLALRLAGQAVMACTDPPVGAQVEERDQIGRLGRGQRCKRVATPKPECASEECEERDDRERIDPLVHAVVLATPSLDRGDEEGELVCLGDDPDEEHQVCRVQGLAERQKGDPHEEAGERVV